MGFNNDGAQALADRLAVAGVRRGNAAVGIPLGISIGKTKTTPLDAATEDYLTSLRLLAPFADYIAVNVSSPNTPGLRSLQDADSLSGLVGALVAEAARLAGPDAPVPVLVKLAPDLSFDALEEALAVCTRAGARGLIATNTTLARTGLSAADQARAAEAGGLSGAPLALPGPRGGRLPGRADRSPGDRRGWGADRRRRPGPARRRRRAAPGLHRIHLPRPGSGHRAQPTDSSGDPMTGYGPRLAAAVAAKGALCVGIDPHPGILARWGLPDDVSGLERCARGMVEALGDLVPVFKPQSAFFEAYGSRGVAVLERTLADLRAVGALSLLDVKRGDIGSTMDAYAAAYLSDGSPLAADAVTLSPYLGFGSLAGAIALAEQQSRGVYVLALTSNPEGREVQHAVAADGRRVAQLVVDAAAAVNAAHGPDELGPVGLVVGATIGRVGIDFSALNGSILAPGLGAQGAGAADLAEVFGPSARLVLPAMSREVLGAGPDPADLRDAARRALAEMNDAVGLR